MRNALVLGWLVSGCALIASTGVAHANDTIAGLDGGVLVLKHTDGIVMESEALNLSLKAVRVRYVFKNTTGTDVETIVAFPLPAMAPLDAVKNGEVNVNYDPTKDNPPPREVKRSAAP